MKDINYTYHTTCRYGPDIDPPEGKRRPFIVIEGNHRHSKLYYTFNKNNLHYFYDVYNQILFSGCYILRCVTFVLFFLFSQKPTHLLMFLIWLTLFYCSKNPFLKYQKLIFKMYTYIFLNYSLKLCFL